MIHDFGNGEVRTGAGGYGYLQISSPALSGLSVICTVSGRAELMTAHCIIGFLGYSFCLVLPC